MKQETISKAKAAQLFAENAVLFGRADGVPEQAATELFGSAAVDFAKRQQNAGLTFNGYGIGDYLRCEGCLYLRLYVRRRYP